MMNRKLAWQILIDEVWDAQLLKAWTQIIAGGYEPTPRSTFGVFGQTPSDHCFN